jgi:hypothetical protein
MTAEAARIADQLANARTGRPIDLPGVIGLLGVPGFIYVNELLVSAEIPRQSSDEHPMGH